MAYNLTGPAEDYNRRGTGPRNIRVGSRGGWPRHADGDADWPVWPSMTSITRLRVMSYLCQHGPVRSLEMARALGESEKTVWQALWGLKSTWAVVPFRSLTKTRRGRLDGWYSIDWEATETGRKWLWRYGWVTRRIGWDLDWQSAGYDGRLDVWPYDVLRDYAEPSLLRATPLAVMHYLTRCPPERAYIIARRCGFGISGVRLRLTEWTRMGWVEKKYPGRDPYGMFPAEWSSEGPLYDLTEEGKQAVERHTAAIRWASQTAGYTPPPDDSFLNDGC